jgi:hypothetical protein
MQGWNQIVKSSLKAKTGRRWKITHQQASFILLLTRHIQCYSSFFW